MDYSRSRKEKAMEEILNLFDMVGKLREETLIENEDNNIMIESYNHGVNAMAVRLRVYLNDKALQIAFGGQNNG